MHFVKLHRFGEIEALELGYGPHWKPPLTVHLYRVGDLMIDSGQRHMARAARQFFHRCRTQRLLLTHHHEDHSGNAALAKRELGVEVLAPPLAIPKLARGFAILPYQHLAWGLMPPVEARPVPALVEGERATLRPIHTPGHSKDHTVYLETERGWLFSGDLYLGDRIKVFRSDERIEQQIESLRAVLGEEFDTLLCAHRPQLSDGRAHLRAKLAFLEDFVGQVARLRAGGDDEQAILRRLKGRRDTWFWLISGGNVSFANMVRSALRAIGGAAPIA